MKQLICVLALALSSSAFAQGSTTATADKSVANAGANSLAYNAGVTIEAAQPLAVTTTNVEYSGTQTVKNVPSVGGPPLTTSNDTCMGSTSGSVNIAGLGIGGGTTWTDKNCKMLKNSRELWNMGMKAASLALMCQDADNKAALELTGFECPQTTKARKEGARPPQAKQSDEYTGNDPIVRARLGLPELVSNN